MSRTHCLAGLAIVALLILAAGAPAAESALSSLKSDSPELQSAGALTFGPEGILFVGDSKAATIFAIDTGDRTKPDSKDLPKVENIDQKIASLLGIEAGQLIVNDMAVNPISGNVYLSISRGKGPDATPAIIRVDRAGKVTELTLKGAKYASAKLPNGIENAQRRQDVITDMGYVKGQLYVAGLSNEEFASNLRSIPFPFSEVNKGSGIQIFHGAHGKLETASPVRTFVPYNLKGETHLLAAYQCTPLVLVPTSELKPGSKVKGTTVAELGNGNRPLDMIVYTKGTKDYLLLANSRRGVMKVPLEGVDKAEGITAKVQDKAGIKYETIEALKGVQHLDKHGDTHAVLLVKTQGGALDLQTIELP
jgi:hypothetical protein